MAQGITLTRGKPVDTAEDGTQQLMHPGEAEVLLALAAPYPQHASATVRGLRGGPVDQGALADPRLTGQHEHLGAVAVRRADQLCDP